MAGSNHLLWELTDKTKLLKNIRDYFDFSSDITDEDISEFATKYLDSYLERYYVVVGNEMELSRIRKPFTALAETFMYGRPILAEPDRFFVLTERLFREGFYIQACISARFTLEKLIQERIKELDLEELSQNQAAKIERLKEMIDSKGKNPGVNDMIKEIKVVDNWSDDFTKKINTIKDYGDWQVHHRFDKIFEGMKFEDFKWGIMDAKIGLSGLQKTEPNLRLTYIENREKKAREHSFEALKYLYEIMSFYRPDLKKNDKNQF